MHGKDWRTGSSKQVWGGHQGSRRQECFSGLTGRWCWNKGAFSGVSCFVPFLVKFKVLSSAGLACILGSIPGTCIDHPSRANYYWRISDSSEGHQGLLSQKSVCVCVCMYVCARLCVCVCVRNGRRLMPGSQTEGRQCCLVFLENSQFSVVLMWY